MPQEPIAIAMKIIDKVDAMLGYWDRDLKCRFANAAYQTWFGRSHEEMIGIPMKELLGPLYELNLPHIEGALRGEPQVFEREIPHPDGSIRHSLAFYYPDIVDGIVQGFSVQVTNVTRLKRLELELQKARDQAQMLATHDFLTGLPNRVLLMDRISNAIARAERENKVGGIVALDLNDFKAVNDEHGHQTGDEVLKEIANRMRGAIRASDSIMRIGGDEFIFLVADVESADDIRSAVHRLVIAISQPITLPGASLIAGFSSGIAVFPTEGTNPAELLAMADKAMYDAKKQKQAKRMFA